MSAGFTRRRRVSPFTDVWSILLLSLTVACATASGSSTGDQRLAKEQRITEPTIKAILPADPAGAPASRGAGLLRSDDIDTGSAIGFSKRDLLDVLFDFDQASLRSDALEILERNASRLKQDRVKRVLLEGRADEIGTAAYNIVGDRRAKSVRSYLQELGHAVEMKTTSYGKDRPLCLEHRKECWQQNRSVHFVVKE